MTFFGISPAPAFERVIERVRRAERSVKCRDERNERTTLVARIGRNPSLDNLIDRRTGYGMLKPSSLAAVGQAIKFAQQVRDSRPAAAKKKADYNPTILEPKRYEDAPAFFDLILSDEVLQIATDYLGEIPVAMGIKLWCSPPNEHMKGSQLYHRDGQKWLLRRAKFLINMDDVDEQCGPFTFLPADVSNRVSASIGSMKHQDDVPDETVYAVAKPSDAIRLIGPAGTGVACDSSQCFHHGARVKRGERLLLQFHFLRRADALHGGGLKRTPAFAERFGNDRIRQLIVPNVAREA
jgi:hypothetical protein